MKYFQFNRSTNVISNYCFSLKNRLDGEFHVQVSTDRQIYFKIRETVHDRLWTFDFRDVVSARR
jgi:hypothetical protein